MMKTIVSFALLGLFFLSCENESEIKSRSDWKPVEISTRAHLNAISFPSENVGFAGGTQRAEYAAHTNIVMDDNYFDYLTEVHLDTDSIPFYKVFYTPVDAPEPVLFKTTNGGTNWEPVLTPFITGVTDIHFVNERVGYVSTDLEGIFKTMDGGETWKRVLSNVIFFGDGLASSNELRRVFFINENKGYVRDPWGYRVAQTNNGGASWFMIDALGPDDDRESVNQILFPFDSETGYAVKDGSFLYKTVDGGENWNKLEFESPYSDSEYRGTINDMSFVDEQTLYMTYDTYPFKSSNGGLTWEPVNVSGALLTGTKIHAVKDGDIILMYGQNDIYRGNTETDKWSELLRLNDAVINDWCFTNFAGFAVGSDGLLLKYQLN
jgi:photosystem II stability/assembly factor-like uncharacterized protein